MLSNQLSTYLSYILIDAQKHFLHVMRDFQCYQVIFCHFSKSISSLNFDSRDLIFVIYDHHPIWKKSTRQIFDSIFHFREKNIFWRSFAKTEFFLFFHPLDPHKYLYRPIIKILSGWFILNYMKMIYTKNHVYIFGNVGGDLFLVQKNIISQKTS